MTPMPITDTIAISCKLYFKLYVYFHSSKIYILKD